MIYHVQGEASQKQKDWDEADGMGVRRVADSRDNVW